MLLGGKHSELKQVAVVTRNPQFSRLLSSILADWKFFTVEDLSSARVILAEWGLELPVHDAKIVWLSPLPLTDGEFLTIPLSLTKLYHLLQSLFFEPARRHIRVPMEMSVEVKIENAWLEAHLISLSDRGGRILCQTEIPRGVSLLVDVKLGGGMLRIPSEVLYCIPAGDSPGRLQAQIGVLFKLSAGKSIDVLRCYIERMSIESACAREEIPLNDSCVSWIDMPASL